MKNNKSFSKKLDKCKKAEYSIVRKQKEETTNEKN